MATVYKNRQLVYLSVIFFFYFANIGCLAPFLTSHMKQLGFSLPEVSFINAVAAFVSLIGPVIGGLVAERYQKYKSVSIIVIFTGAVVFSVISFIPRTERVHHKPIIDFSCSSGLRIERCSNWDTCSDAISPDNVTTIQLTDCRYQCRRGSAHASSTHPLHICFHGEPGNICVVYDPESGNTSATEFDTQLSLWQFEERSHQGSTVAGGEGNDTKRISTSAHDVFDPSWLEDENTATNDKLRTNRVMCYYHPHGPISLNQKQYNSISCRPSFKDCDIRCRASFAHSGSSLTFSSCEEANGNPWTTFWSYLTLRCIGDLCLLTAVCLLDALLVTSTSDFEGAYGRMHVWPVLGIAAFAPFSGALLDHFTDAENQVTYFPAVFVAAGLAVLTCALIIALPVGSSKRSAAQFQSLIDYKGKKPLSFELFMFMVVVIVLGMQWGVIFTFLPFLTEDIGCSGMVTGLGYTMIFGCCLPFLLISKNMVRNIGRANLLVFALLFYGTRYAGVSYVFSPWWTLPFAAMGAFTLCVMWVASVAYGQALAPYGYSLVMQYVLNLLHFGVGRGIGSLLGGTVISHHGLRMVFRGIAIFSACIGLLYLLIYHTTVGRQKAKKKSTFPAMNGAWYPLREQHPNGDAKTNQLSLAVYDDDSDLADTNAAASK